MRPIRLELEGFTSFRKRTEIDFSPLRLFAITGPTGAGKSSLIDAILFALYGRTPRISRSTSDLITQGAQKLNVLLEFSSGPETYRLSRVQIRGKSGSCRLERRTEGGDWEPLAGKAGDVQKQIQQIIGLDFDGFTRSVVLPQGAFDEFLRGDTQKRRKILKDLLSLDVCDAMRQTADQRARIAAGQAATIRTQLEQHLADATEDNLATERSALAEAEAASARLSRRRDELAPKLEAARELRQWRKQAAEARNRIVNLEQEIEQARRTRESALEQAQEAAQELTRWRQAVEAAGYDHTLHLDLRSLEAKALQRESIREKAGALEAQKKGRLNRLAEAEISWEALRQTAAKAAAALTRAQEAVSEAEHRLQELAARYESRIAIELALQAIETVESQQEQHRRWSARLDQLRREAATAVELASHLEQQHTAAETAYEEAVRHLDHLRTEHAAAALRQGLSPGDPCPVCERIVDLVPHSAPAEGLDAAAASVRQADERRHAAASAARNKRADCKALEAQIAGLAAQVEEAAQAAAAQLSRVSRLLGDATPGPDPKRRLTELRDAFAAAETECTTRRTALLERERAAAECEARLQKSGFERESLRKELERLNSDLGAATSEVQALERELGQWSDLARLREALSRQEQAWKVRQEAEEKAERTQLRLRQMEDASRDARQLCDLRTSELAAAVGARDQLAREIAAREDQLLAAMNGVSLPPQQDEAAWFESQQADLYQQLLVLGNTLAVAGEKIRRLEQQIRQATLLRENLKSLEQEKELYNQFANLLKGNQFVDYVTGYALRALSHEATRYLEHMSSGRYSFVCDDNGFGVIDHWNADEQRGAETLSGGESFFASLSLALALAESLSRFTIGREDLRLESLFLDEGFSTLDAETLDVVLAGLEALDWQDRLVGVISHIPELSERMEARVVVRKALGGSTVEVDL